MNSSDSFDSLFPPGALEGIVSNSKDSSDQPYQPRQKIWKISELLEHLNDILFMEYGKLWIEGEISSITIPRSGHQYFTLKDERASLRSVLFKSQARALSVPISEGQKVVCLGRLNIYGARGDLQMIVEALEPWGEGRLRIAFEELKRRLGSEGLFDMENKKPLPEYPDKILVISSTSGAAIRDFIKTAKDRFPAIRILICPSVVQGQEAPEELVRALDLAESMAGKRDVIVIARGGGSLEDLWAFNSEDLVRRIFSCKVPVVSAVGHEVDFTLCDLVADARAATPTAAAHLVLPSRPELAKVLEGLELRLTSAFKNRISFFRQQLDRLCLRLKDPRRAIIERRLRLDELERRLITNIGHRLQRLFEMHGALSQRLHANSPKRLLKSRAQQLRALYERLPKAISSHLKVKRALLEAHAGRLEAVSPLACLARGYSLVYREDSGAIVKDARQVGPEDKLRIVPAHGKIICKVLKTINGNKKVEDDPVE